MFDPLDEVRWLLRQELCRKCAFASAHRLLGSVDEGCQQGQSCQACCEIFQRLPDLIALVRNDPPELIAPYSVTARDHLARVLSRGPDEARAIRDRVSPLGLYSGLVIQSIRSVLGMDIECNIELGGSGPVDEKDTAQPLG